VPRHETSFHFYYLTLTPETATGTKKTIELLQQLRDEANRLADQNLPGIGSLSFDNLAEACSTIIRDLMPPASTEEADAYAAPDAS